MKKIAVPYFQIQKRPAVNGLYTFTVWFHLFVAFLSMLLFGFLIAEKYVEGNPVKDWYLVVCTAVFLWCFWQFARTYE